jgi:DNA repair protein RecN (Recombination protein N)
MLVKLYVRNYALIKELDIELENGLTIITGETGAGKSILLGALSLILGTRADTSALLDKNEKCIVEGAFNADENLKDFFQTNEIDYDRVTILRREINPSGKSMAFINDTPVTVNLLKEIGERLIDIHSQRQTILLNDSSFQLSLVDSFAGTSDLLQHYKRSYDSFKKLKNEYAFLKENSDKTKADVDYYTFQVNQLNEAKLKAGEQEELEAEAELLTHAGEINEGLAAAAQFMSAEDTSVLSLIREVRGAIGRIKNYLPEGELLFSRLDSCSIELNDIALEFEKLASAIEADPQRLAIITGRLDLIYSLCQKHRAANLSELVVKSAELNERLNALVYSDERIIEIESQLIKEKTALKEVADTISGLRNKVIPEIESKATSLLTQLGIPNAKFRIEMWQSDDFRPSGIDNADFLFSANKQTVPENLSKVASGGELSRVMLSIKSLLSKNNSIPTIIFDEIDSGVSGEVADKVGQILAGMGKYMQVINITHLPQVAARGSRHFYVFKKDTDNSTVTSVRLLSDNERVAEVARLLSGSEITETAMKNAMELIQSAI